MLEDEEFCKNHKPTELPAHLTVVSNEKKQQTTAEKKHGTTIKAWWAGQTTQRIHHTIYHIIRNALNKHEPTIRKHVGHQRRVFLLSLGIINDA